MIYVTVLDQSILHNFRYIFTLSKWEIEIDSSVWAGGKNKKSVHNEFNVRRTSKLKIEYQN